MNHVSDILAPVANEQRTCDVHGAYSSVRVAGRWTPCPACTRDQIQREAAQTQHRAQQERLDAILSAAGIPPRYAAARLDDGRHSAQARAWLASIQREPGGSLLLLGQVGTGKSHLACALVREACARGIQARYETIAGFLRKIRDTWDSSETTERRVFDAAAGVPLLVLDEIGAGLRTDKDAVRIHELIDERYVRALSTVFVTNLTPPQLKEAVGDRAYDRMRDGSTAINITGESRRHPKESTK